MTIGELSPCGTGCAIEESPRDKYSDKFSTINGGVEQGERRKAVLELLEPVGTDPADSLDVIADMLLAMNPGAPVLDLRTLKITAIESPPTTLVDDDCYNNREVKVTVGYGADREKIVDEFLPNGIIVGRKAIAKHIERVDPKGLDSDSDRLLIADFVQAFRRNLALLEAMRTLDVDSIAAVQERVTATTHEAQRHLAAYILGLEPSFYGKTARDQDAISTSSEVGEFACMFTYLHVIRCPEEVQLSMAAFADQYLRDK